MLRRIWIVYNVELAKAARLKQTYAGPLFIVLAVIGGMLAYPIQHDGISDYAFIAYITPTGIGFLGFLLVLIYSAGLVSSEMGDGSIRQTLLRPVTRDEIILAKMLLGMSYATLLFVLVAVLSWLLAASLGELSGVIFGGEVLYTAEEMLLNYVLGTLLGLLPQWAGVALAILISTCTRSAVTAVSSVIGLWIVVDLVKYPLHFAPYAFFTYLESPWQVFVARSQAVEQTWFPMSGYCIVSSCATILLCTLLAVAVFRRRNVCQ